MALVDKLVDIGKLIQKSDNIELYQKLLAVQTDALELIGKLHEKTEEIHRLKKKLEKVNHVADVRSRCSKVYSCYYEFDTEDPIEGPYCATCLDNGRITHIVLMGADRVKCPECDIQFSDPKAVYYVKNGNLEGEYKRQKIKLSEKQKRIRTEY